jgi:hypothetical protein
MAAALGGVSGAQRPPGLQVALSAPDVFGIKMGALPYGVREQFAQMQYRTDVAGTAWTRSKLVDHLAGLYSLREDMRRADKPVMVHVLTAMIKIRTHTLRQIDGTPPASQVGAPKGTGVREIAARSN